jgi:7-cyano-7-deazaguanine reductase
MAIAEGKSFTFESEDSIKNNFLELINYNGNSQRIIYKTEEFNAVCPFSGLPDIGTLTIEYIPKNNILELKALKYYLTSYRNVGIYQEAATNRIYNDLTAVLNPERLIVTTEYNIRGGILSTCIMDSQHID